MCVLGEIKLRFFGLKSHNSCTSSDRERVLSKIKKFVCLEITTLSVTLESFKVHNKDTNKLVCAVKKIKIANDFNRLKAD